MYYDRVFAKYGQETFSVFEMEVLEDFVKEHGVWFCELLEIVPSFIEVSNQLWNELRDVITDCSFVRMYQDLCLSA